MTVPEKARLIDQATLKIADARSVYVASTYAYVAAGKNGLAIVDVEKPERRRLDQMFNAEGAIDDVNDVKVAMTNACVFAYVADGHERATVCSSFRRTTPPARSGSARGRRPADRDVSQTHEPALSVSKGLDRDRAVDESGNQVAVFGRRGGRPLNLEEQRKMYHARRQRVDRHQRASRPGRRPEHRRWRSAVRPGPCSSHGRQR